MAGGGVVKLSKNFTLALALAGTEDAVAAARIFVGCGGGCAAEPFGVKAGKDRRFWCLRSADCHGAAVQIGLETHGLRESVVGERLATQLEATPSFSAPRPQLLLSLLPALSLELRFLPSFPSASPFSEITFFGQSFAISMFARGAHISRNTKSK